MRVLAVLGVLAVLPLLHAAQPADPKKQLERGRQIYVEGTSPSGGEITAVMSEAGLEVPATAVPCASCHGRDGKGQVEGGVTPTDLIWSHLTKPYGVTHPSGRQHPPYDERSLKRSISLGIDPAGNKLHVAMPRFRMSLQDMEDLVAYVRQLGTRTDPGVSDTTLRVGVVLPPAGPLTGMGQAVRSALMARFEALNQSGGIYGRRVEPRFLEAPGPPEQRRAWAADFLEREEVFASVASFLAGADSELAALFQEKEIPLIGPFTIHPREEFPLNRYVFYLLPGVEAQGQALLRFARGKWEGAHKSAVVAPAGPELDGAVEALTRAAAVAGWPAPLVHRFQKGQDVRKLAAAQADPVFFLGSGAEGLALLQEADRQGWRPRFLATAAAADDSLFRAPAAFDGKVFLALPMPPGGPAPDAAATYRDLAAKARLPAGNASAQFSALAAAEVLIEALERAGRDLSREKLVDELEKLRQLHTGFAPPITYSASRRLGARGAFVMRVDLAGKRLVPEGGWLEVE